MSIIEQAVAHLQAKFEGNLDCLFIGGSHANGDANPASDLDVVVLCKSLPNAYRLSETHDGIAYDLKVYDFDSLVFELNFEKNSSFKGLLPILITRKIMIPEDSANGKIIHNLASRIFDEGPNVPPVHINMMRHDITNMLHNFRRTDLPFNEQAAFAVNLYNSCSQLALLRARQFIYGGKWMARVLKKAAPQHENALLEGVQQFFIHKDFVPLTKAAQAILDEAGGELWEGYRLDFPPNRRMGFGGPGTR